MHNQVLENSLRHFEPPQQRKIEFSKDSRSRKPSKRLVGVNAKTMHQFSRGRGEKINLGLHAM